MNGFGQQYGRALTTARRRARLSGRRLSAQETAGMTRGLAESASARLARGKGLELQERGLTQQASQFQTGMEETRAARGQRQSQFEATQEQRGSLQTERLAALKERQELGQRWQAGQTQLGFSQESVERREGETFQTGESELDRAELIRQFDILYGGPSEELTSAQQRLKRLQRKYARPQGAVYEPYTGGGGSER